MRQKKFEWKISGSKYLQDAKDIFYCLISRKHFKQTITGKNYKPKTGGRKTGGDLRLQLHKSVQLLCQSKLVNFWHI